MNGIVSLCKSLERNLHPRTPDFKRAPVAPALLSISVLLWLLLLWLPSTLWAKETSSEPPPTRTEQKVLHQAQTALSEKAYDKAKSLLVAHMSAHPDGVHYLVAFALGNVFSLSGDPAAALTHYKAAAEGAPKDAAIRQNMGKAYYDLERFEEAGECLSQAHALTDPADPNLAYQAAVAYIFAEKPAAALPLLEAITTGDAQPPKAEWFEALLKVYVDLKMSKQVLALARRLIGREGDSPRLWQALTHLYIEQRAYQEAAAAMEIYLGLVPGNREAIRQLGDLYHMAGIPLQAARRYEALLTDDAAASLYERTATAYMAAHQMDKAAAILRNGLDRRSTARMWWLSATIHFENEAYVQAYEAFEKSTRINPKYARAYLMMGYCALQYDRLGDARAAFQKAARSPKLRAEANRMIEQIDSYEKAVAGRR